MPHFVQQRRENLPAHLCLACADGFDVSLVKVNPIPRAGRSLARRGEGRINPLSGPELSFSLLEVAAGLEG